jgi:ABC-type glycerol-3-phosphate transport system permease component
LHVALICSVGIFLLPMLWMVFVSLKTDEELTDPGWLPKVPTFVARSPYVLPAPVIPRPVVVSESVWRERLPALVRETRQAVAESASAPGAADVDHDAHVDAATAAVVARLAPRVPAKSWEADESSLLAAYRPLLTPRRPFRRIVGPAGALRVRRDHDAPARRADVQPLRSVADPRAHEG